MDVEKRPYTKLVPLIEILAHTMGKGRPAKSVVAAYHHICDELGGEIQVLTQAGYGDLEQIGGEALADAVVKIRSGQVAIVPGFDGQYGTVLPAD